MSGKVTLEITEGPMAGRNFVFEEHDTFLFGRSPECQACLPNDPKVSRHHFIMEVNPPDARIHDLGSMNGTYVNDVRHGGREEGETPEEGARRRYPEVDLKDGDRIRVGQTVLAMRVETPMFCGECGRELVGKDREERPGPTGIPMCPACEAKLKAVARAPRKPEPVRCQKCGKDVSGEAGKGRQGPYVCKACRAQVEADPMAVLRQMLAAAAAQKQPVLDIAGYDIEKKLGKGGMGAVYLARRKVDNARVALKVMLAKVAVDERARSQFLREIEVTRTLRHPNIVELFEHGSAGIAFYFTMEFCGGGSVDRLMAEHGGRLPLDLAGPIMLDTLEGLAYAHTQSFVHRDLKPQNILLTGSEGHWTAKVSDFGLSKNFDRAGFSGMTVTGTTAGTPPFMAREQVTNFKRVKPVTDVWSIAATFYNMLTGALPRNFRVGADPIEAILHGEVVPIRTRDPGIPSKVAEVIDRALSDKIADRYQDAAEMLTAMKQVL